MSSRNAGTCFSYGFSLWFDCRMIVPSPRRSTLMSRLRKSIGLKGACITLSNAFLRTFVGRDLETHRLA